MIKAIAKKHWEKLAKLGYGSRGLMYLMIGGLALIAALGLGGKTTNSKGAIEILLSQPFGKIYLAVLIIGLMGYVGWRAFQAIADTDNHGMNVKGLAIRAGLLASAISHTLLTIWAIKLILGASSNDNNNLGEWLSSEESLVFLVGVGVILLAVGTAHIFKGWKARFDKYMDVPTAQRIWVIPLCRIGLLARGAAWIILGVLFLQSSLATQKNNMKGIEDVFTWLSHNYAGAWLLSAMAVGLCAFGCYSVLEGFYRRIHA